MAIEAYEGSTPKNLKQDEEAFSEDLVVSTSAATPEFTDDAPMSPVNSSGSGSQASDDLDDNVSDYDEDIFSYDFVNSSCDDLMSVQSRLDSLNIPPWIELSLDCLEKSASTQQPAALSASKVPSKLTSQSKKEKVAVWLKQSTESITDVSQPRSCIEEEKLAATSNSTFYRENEENDVLEKFRLFKQLDMVEDYSDHHFIHGDSKSKQAPQMWEKTIQQEWKILEKDLPDTIFVRGYEERRDLLRAVIVGTPGTPYHDNLFFFDLFFPSDYPNVPPHVFYYSNGLGLNPKLSVCGKVCLGLLKGDEEWTPGKSNVLQVLQSIQARVLVGFEEGEDYNEDTFIQSYKTLLYTMSRPPKHYEDFVDGYFRLHAHKILEAGAEVGCLSGSVQDSDEQTKGGSQNFKAGVLDILPRLVQAFKRNEAEDCEQFLNNAAPGTVHL